MPSQGLHPVVSESKNVILHLVQLSTDRALPATGQLGIALARVYYLRKDFIMNFNSSKPAPLSEGKSAMLAP
jgi:hypothetical protein